MYIKSLHLRGFKSFNRKTDIYFCPNMNVILGPNGSGKSNIGDAICFVLGRLSSKDLRAENFADLLFKRKDTVAAEGEVSLVLDNSKKVFPFEEKEVEIKRKIKKTGQTVYKINGKTATRQEVLELLALAHIFPDGHNIILQGDIARFVDLKPIERRQIIEEIAGIANYEEKKNKALAELTKVDERLREINIILKEKEAYMKNLNEEKKGAEKYKQLQSELRAAQAGELMLKYKNAKSKQSACSSAIETKLIDINNTKLDIEILTKKAAQLKSQLEELEKEIQKKGGEESLRLQKELEQIKIEVANARNLLSTSISELDKIAQRKKDLELNFAAVQQKIAQSESERKKLLEKQTQIKKEIEELKESPERTKTLLVELEKNLTSIEQKIDSLQSERNYIFEELAQAKAKKETIESELMQIRSKKVSLEQASKELNPKSLENLELELQTKSKEQTNLAIQIGELKKAIIQKESALLKAKALFSTSQELLSKDSVIKFLREKKVKGLIGLVAELAKVPNQFSTALNVAGGNRLKNIVVEDTETAIKCLELLKQNKIGFATFLPLDRLVMQKIDVPKNILTKPGVLGLATEILEYEPKYKKVFLHVFRDTLVVKDIQTAKELEFEKHRLVTLDGDLFEQSGAITGGYRHGTPQFFEPKEKLSDLEKEIENLRKEQTELEKKKAKLDSEILKIQAEKLELEAKIKISNLSTKDLPNLAKREQELLAQKQKLEVQCSEFEKKIKDFEKNLEELRAEREQIKNKLRDVQSRTTTNEIETLNTQILEIESAIAALSATIENALLPEKENISRVLKELEKEKKAFETQKLELERKIAELNKLLEKKELEQKEFHGKLKQAFENQANLSNCLRETQASLDAATLKLSSLEQEKNNLVIEAAQYAAELTSLEEELKAFADVAPKEFKTLEEAKNKIREIQSKIEALGPINMRALEVFQDILKEYNELSVRVSKLQEEKQSILQIIDEVESKKTEAFMKTFTQLNTYFSKLYQKINLKYLGELVLENPQKPFDGGVVVALKDLKHKRVSPTALSGGEKVLVALAFIFAIQEFEPAPFYLLDEIDAALDKLNSEQVAKLLKESSRRSQIIVISHNDAVISEGDVLYGVSMTKEGESAVVSLKL
ncbi:MAG: chromosome segregation protein SMC [Candidatus Nanoarchaeia archaeon]